MAAYEVLLLNTAVPQIQAAQSGDTYVVPRDIAINATAIISANSATDALRITQTGAGNAILVEDSANPDSTPFVVTAAGDVGIGTTLPAYPLHVVGNVNGAFTSGVTNSNAGTSSVARFIAISDAGNATFGMTSSGYTDISGAADALLLNANNASNGMIFALDGNVKMKLDTSGNLGLGVTPSAWSGFRALQVGGATSIWSSTSGAGSSFYSNNVYFNGSNRIRINAGYATEYIQDSSGGAHIWYNAASSTAGSTITFTQAMTLDADGDLGIGETSPVGALHIKRSNGQLLLQNGTSAAEMRISAFNNAGNANAAIIFEGYSNAYGRFTADSNFKVGGSANRGTTEGTNQLVLFNGTAPAGTLANGISIYSSSGEAYVMDAAGNATLFSPHDAETNEWIFKSKHTPTGKVLKIDVERLLKFVNDHFGLDAVHEFVEE